MAKLSKKVVTGILDKLEIEYTTKITLKRAKDKLNRALEDGGVPEDVELTTAEIAALEEMGFEIDLDDDDEDQEPSDKDLEGIEDEEEDDEDDDEDEPTPPKKEKKAAGKKKEKKAAPKKSKKKMGKYTAVCTILKKRKNHTFAKLAEEADALYVKNGGESNVEGTLKFCVTTVKVLEEYGVVTIDGENVKVL